MESTMLYEQQFNHISTSSLNFYRPNALPDAQPAVSHTHNRFKALMDFVLEYPGKQAPERYKKA